MIHSVSALQWPICREVSLPWPHLLSGWSEFCFPREVTLAWTLHWCTLHPLKPHLRAVYPGTVPTGLILISDYSFPVVGCGWRVAVISLLAYASRPMCYLSIHSSLNAIQGKFMEGYSAMQLNAADSCSIRAFLQGMLTVCGWMLHRDGIQRASLHIPPCHDLLL